MRGHVQVSVLCAILSACRRTPDESAARSSETSVSVSPEDDCRSGRPGACLKLAGSATNCVEVGAKAEDGRGRKRDTQLAAKLYEAACDGSVMAGCTDLGLLVERGEGTSRDLQRAASLHERACTGGDADGCANLGVMNDN